VNHIRNKPGVNHMMNWKTTQVTMGIPSIMTGTTNENIDIILIDKANMMTSIKINLIVKIVMHSLHVAK
jgi:hypothetical protein